MAKFSIISKDGTSVRYTGYPRYNGSYMGVGVLEFSEISSPSPIAWEIGDFVDYRNGRYRLHSLPEPKKQARQGEYGASFVYTGVQFHSPVKDLEIALFRDLVTEDNEIHFSTLPDVSTYEDVYGIARRIQECMDDMYPGKWQIKVHESEDEELNNLLSEVKEFSLSNGTCLDALSLIYDTWKNIGWVHTTEGNLEVISIARANVRDEENTTSTFSYGKGNGLTAIRRASANRDEFATRLYVYGSERNLPPRYYNSKAIKDAESVHIPNLMLPIDSWGKTDGIPDARLAYLEADANIVRKYGLIPRVVRFDGNEREEIYPSIQGLTAAEVREAMIEAGYTDKYIPGDEDIRIDEVVVAETPSDYGNIANADGSTRTDSLDTTFILEANTFGFKVEDQAALAGESNARISMKSGKCAGRDFVIKSSEWRGGTWWLTMERHLDDSLNMLFPNQDYPILPGDLFVLLDIAMPEYYITLAQKRMYEEGMKVLADYTRTSAYYEPQIDAKVMYEHGTVIREGMFMKVVDEDIIDTEDNSDYVLIDTLSIDERSEIPTYNVTLREQKRAAKGISALEGMIDDAKESTGKVLEEAKQFSKRSFSSALQTLEMLKDAFDNFSEGIDPVTVQTMALLVGDESLQFKFVSETVSTGASVNPGITYDKTRRIIRVARKVRLMHMTLGINEVTAKDGRSFDEYLKWTMNAWTSDVLSDADKGYYLYAKVDKEGTEGHYMLSENTIGMESENGYYHLLVGILNAEVGGDREFISLYGFTEVLPGRITTELIRSADGNAVLDLESGELRFGEFVGLSGASGDEVNLRMWAGAGKETRNEAPFRVYDNGDVYASLLHLLLGCKIGNLNVTERGISAEVGCLDTPGSSRDGARFDEDEFHVSRSYNTGSACVIKCSSRMGADGIRVTGNPNYSDMDTAYQATDSPLGYRATRARVGYVFGDLSLDEQDDLPVLPQDTFSFYATKGKMAGLRPNIRNVSSGETLFMTDHTVIVGGGVVYLPNSPIDGQEYKVIHPITASLQIRNIATANRNVSDFKNATEKSYMVQSTSAETIELIFCGADNTWYANKY